MATCLNVGEALGVVSSVIVICGGGIACYRWYGGRRKPRVWVERDVNLADPRRRATRYTRHSANSLKRYTEVWVENQSTKPFWFLRGEIRVPEVAHTIFWTIGNDGAELLPKERMSFVMENDAKGGTLQGGTLNLFSHGWEKMYRLS